MRVHSMVVPLQGKAGRRGPFPRQLETPHLLLHWEIIMQDGFLVGSLFVCRKSSLWTLEAGTEPWSGECCRGCGEDMRRNSLVVQWVELHAFIAVAPGLIPVGELRSHKSPAVPHPQQKEKEKKKKEKREGVGCTLERPSPCAGLTPGCPMGHDSNSHLPSAITPVFLQHRVHCHGILHRGMHGSLKFYCITQTGQKAEWLCFSFNHDLQSTRIFFPPFLDDIFITNHHLQAQKQGLKGD